MPKIVAFALEVFLCSGGNLTPFSIAKLDIILQSTKLERKKRQKSLLIISETHSQLASAKLAICLKKAFFGV
jgi:hypothetical protein